MQIIYNEEKLTLKNFERWINPAILQRGKKYYKDGAVLSIEEDEGDWTAEVEGSDCYQVTITILAGEEIGDYYCDCPYDGDTCKHIAAVLFTIRDEFKEVVNIPENEKKKNQFDALLSKISADEYRTFVKHFAGKNKDFKIAFEVFFADKDDRLNVGEKYTELIQKLFKKHAPHGFIEYRSATGFAREIDKFIGDANSFIKKGNYKDAFSIASVLLKEVLWISLSADDSSGDIGGIIFDVVELIDDIVADEDAAVDIKEAIFKFITDELHNERYFDGDIGYNLFETFEILAGNLGKSTEFLDFIDTKLRKPGGGYTRNFFLEKKIAFLENAGRAEEVVELINENLHIKTIRQDQVDKAISARNFETAKMLIAGGIQIAEKENLRGTLRDWEEQLLRIAEIENDILTIRRFCKQFAFGNMFNKQYYNQWKNTFSADEWGDIIEKEIEKKIKEAINYQKKNKWRSLNSELLSNLAPFYIEENYPDRLFALVKNEPGLDCILQYHKYLCPHYPTELIEIYLPALDAYADRVNERSGYSALVSKIEMILTDIPAGKDQIMDLVKQLKIRYARRPAMIDELRKL
ncbi:SWIM zinc finger family protein [Mucilaginibacter sp. SJ]|uniref:SWIM zinc finger family protein n=1 Tax=Mucilaginibacter sp. SJ TaxID=3029053 RepID=UPI0023A9ABE2|nr:SWIM zinc finger family protein [Mucilaginibacter sp. SJ]WDZ98568.1 SWIM zinc finger family protein [Mucilaginibacter sp. SJ]